MTDEQIGRRNVLDDWSPEALVRKIELHEELIDRYYKSEARDEDLGRTLGLKWFEWANHSGDPRTIPLIGPQGLQEHDEQGRPLMAVEIINLTASRSIDRLPLYLGFLLKKPGDEGYDEMRQTILAWPTAVSQ